MLNVRPASCWIGLCLALSIVVGCQTGIQRPTRMVTEVITPDVTVAPATDVIAPATVIAVPSEPVVRQVSRDFRIAGAASAWPSNWINKWIPLESWGKYNELNGFTKLGDGANPNYRLQTTSGYLSVRIGSRVAEWDGLECWLGFAPQMIGGVPYVHWLDAQKTLQPLVRPALSPRDSRTIVIDAGHGGRDKGAVSSSSTHEKHYTLDWALRVQRLLGANGWKVIMTRTTDVDLSLGERVAIADQANADFFVSLHFNSGSANRELAGVETYCLTPTGMPSHLTREYEDDVRQVFPNNAFDEENLQTAFRLHRVLVQSSGANDRGVRRARFMTVLRGQNRPAVLVEGGYLSNPAEAQRIASAAYRQTLAEAIARGLQ
jgi:N-acetylmuramoyl-L-alanine amidase